MSQLGIVVQLLGILDNLSVVWPQPFEGILVACSHLDFILDI